MPENTKKCSYLSTKTKEDFSKSVIHPPTSIGTLDTHKTVQEAQRKAIVCKFAPLSSKAHGGQGQTLSRVQTHTDGGCQGLTHAADYSS